ncbi:MAG: helix-turn-helix domain-containing protein [Saprospiraceae bacterium]|nr:helix-turn-helix domain-containing protein [Saprospiraceae bacterium]
MTAQKHIPSTDIQQDALLVIRPLTPFIDRTVSDGPPHRHTFQEIIFLKSGKGQHFIDGQIFQLEANTIYLIGQGQVHYFQKGEKLKGYLLRYKENLLPPQLTFYSKDYSLVQMLTNSNALSLSKADVRLFDANFTELYNEHLKLNSNSSSDIEQLILLTILSRIKQKIRTAYEQSMRNTSDSNDGIVSRLVLLIEDNYKAHHDLPFYHKKLGISNRKLLSVTQDKVGITPKQLINQRLMTEATRLLKFTDLSLKEISYELGYTEPAYFSRLFKRKMHVSPKAYREKMK